MEAVSIVTASVDVFDLVDALGTQNGKMAQKLLHRLLEDKDAFEIFGMVVRQFRLLTIARDVMDEGGTLQEVTERAGGASFCGRKSLQTGAPSRWRRFRPFITACWPMDDAAKTGLMPLDLALDTLIVELAGRS